MVAWDDFATAAPELAKRGRRLFERRGDGEALLASVKDDLPPRTHPINVAIVDGRLLAFLIVGSGKVAEHAVFGERATAGDWPPVYTSWRAKP